MGEKSNIGWTDSTVNFWSGCTKVSAGCKNCYAETLSNRNLGNIGKWGRGAPRALHESAFMLAHRLNRKPWICDDCGHTWGGLGEWCPACESVTIHRRRIFSLSLGDWLDAEVPIAWLAEMLDTVRQCDKVTWILCTKRPENFRPALTAAGMFMTGNSNAPAQVGVTTRYDCGLWVADWLSGRKVPKNIVLLASVENQEQADNRIPQLLEIPAACRGLSLEPLLGSVELKPSWTGGGGLYGVNIHDPQLEWLIIGGESGPGARPCNVEWIRSLAAQGKAAGVATFVKQLGANPFEIGGASPGVDAYEIKLELKDKKGGDLSEWPEDLRVQQWPKGF